MKLTAPDYGRRVEVYRNLHRKCYSVRDYKTKRVIYHTNSISLTSAKCFVQEGGRQRVLKEGRKNVHAYIRGIWSGVPNDGGDKVSYNPYKSNKFKTSTGKDINMMTSVYLGPCGVKCTGEYIL